MCACACVHCWLGKCDVLCIQVLLAGNNETSEKVDPAAGFILGGSGGKKRNRVSSKVQRRLTWIRHTKEGLLIWSTLCIRIASVSVFSVPYCCSHLLLVQYFAEAPQSWQLLTSLHLSLVKTLMKMYNIILKKGLLRLPRLSLRMQFLLGICSACLFE